MNTRSVFLVLALIALFGSAVGMEAAQEIGARIIQRLPVEKNEPVAITELKLNNRSVSFDKKFVADDEWLRGLVISVKNQSNKVILFASIQLQFPPPSGSPGTMAVDDISYGSRRLETELPTPEDIRTGIAPGKTVEMMLSAQQFADINRFLGATGHTHGGDRLHIRVDKIIFQDDLMWSRGAYLQRNPADLKTWFVAP